MNHSYLNREKTPIPPIGAPCQDKDGADSGISTVYLWHSVTYQGSTLNFPLVWHNAHNNFLHHTFTHRVTDNTRNSFVSNHTEFVVLVLVHLLSMFSYKWCTAKMACFRWFSCILLFTYFRDQGSDLIKYFTEIQYLLANKIICFVGHNHESHKTNRHIRYQWHLHFSCCLSDSRLLIHSKTPHVVTMLWLDSDWVEGYKTVYLCHLDSYTVTVYTRYLVSSHVVTLQLPTRCLVDRFLHRPHGSGTLITYVSDVVTIK